MPDRRSQIDHLVVHNSSRFATVMVDRKPNGEVRVWSSFSSKLRKSVEYRNDRNIKLLGFMSAHAVLAKVIERLFRDEHIVGKRFRYHPDFEHLARRMNAIDELAQPILRRQTGIAAEWVRCTPTEEDRQWAEQSGVEVDHLVMSLREVGKLRGFDIEGMKVCDFRMWYKPKENEQPHAAPRQTLPEKLEELMADGEPHVAQDLVEALGYFRKDVIYATLHRMFKYGLVHRLERGVYQLTDGVDSESQG